MRLKNRVALVRGAASSIGPVTALDLEVHDERETFRATRY
jgi:hypothetical protein